MPTHFNLLGQADGYNHKVFAIFGLPALMLLMHWLILFLMIKDPKSSNISSKIQLLIYWIIPFVSCLLMISIFGESLGYSMMSGLLAQIFMGVVMIVIGNYLPKTHRNYIIGIRLPWTLESDKNWRKTHRLAGKNLGVRRIVIVSKFLCSNICLLGVFLDTSTCGVDAWCLFISIIKIRILK